MFVDRQRQRHPYCVRYMGLSLGGQPSRRYPSLPPDNSECLPPYAVGPNDGLLGSRHLCGLIQSKRAGPRQ